MSDKKEEALLGLHKKLADELKSTKVKMAELEEQLQELRERPGPEPKREPDRERTTEDAVTRWAERQMTKEAEREKRVTERARVRRPREIEEQSADVLSQMLKDVQEEF